MLSQRLEKMLEALDKLAHVDKEQVKIARAPGRANLIGEHTDYNEGYVLPCTIDRDVIMAAQPADKEVVLHAINFHATERFPLTGIRLDPTDRWLSYVKGVVHQLQRSGYRIDGLRGVIDGTVPMGAGLGSSAALEVATALMFQLLYDLKISPIELALTCFKAENESVGVSCGMMDQFASALGREDRLLFLDCRTLNYELVELPSTKIRLVLLNTMIERAAEQVLNRRKLECQKAVRMLGKHRPHMKALRDLSSNDFEELKTQLPSTIQKRCQHVVHENERVLAMVEAVKKADYNRIGALMYASHASCKNLYEVSCKELDLMVETARKVNGVIGCRMTGAGLGGCAVSLVWDWAVEELSNRVHESYKEKTGTSPEIYVCTIPSRAGELSA